jgi:hypothetical protein
MAHRQRRSTQSHRTQPSQQTTHRNAGFQNLSEATTPTSQRRPRTTRRTTATQPSRPRRRSHDTHQRNDRTRTDQNDHRNAGFENPSAKPRHPPAQQLQQDGPPQRGLRNPSAKPRHPTSATIAAGGTTATRGFRGLGPRSRHDERPRSALSADKDLSNSRGAEGTRTPDPHTASVVRYQLRHSPLPVPGRPGTEEILHTPAGTSTDPPQFRDGSGGKWATAARISPWRRRTMAHRSSGRLMNGSPGSASKTNQEPSATSSSS